MERSQGQVLRDDFEAMMDWYQDARGSATEALGHVASLKRELETVEAITVKNARLDGATWQDIATILGVTRQSAWNKYRNVDERYSLTSA